MDNIDHGNEPARFPCIELEKHLSRIQGLTQFMINNPERRPHCDVILQQVHEAAEEARSSFREVLTNQREERMRLIELSCASGE